MSQILAKSHRFLSLDTPHLDKNKLILRSFTGEEEISQLFNFQLDLVSMDNNINFDKVVGQPIIISVIPPDGKTIRFFNGYISRFSQLPGEGRMARYQAEMVPWLWFLSRTTDCVIYQDLSVPDIISQVFQKYKFQNYSFELKRSYEPLEYCVQYRETALNFVMRLLEEEGIYFFFRHEQDKHTLVLVDIPESHQPCPLNSNIKYEHVFSEGYNWKEEVISSWRNEQEFGSGQYTLTDFNFQQPSFNLQANSKSNFSSGANERFEIYDYPGDYFKLDDGERVVRLRMEEEDHKHTIITGESDCRSLSSGYWFTLYGHERKDQNGKYLVTKVTHAAHNGSIEYSTSISNQTEVKEEAKAFYRNTFTCIPYPLPFRPPRVTPKPLVHGSQTAIVVGPEGEEIYTDKYGRVKVQFHWDRLGRRDDKSSCWIRVSQPWAGKGYGGMSIPRIGQEVIVDFLEGDPDRPIITGRVYNREQMPPYPLPENKAHGGIMSRSTPGGGMNNFNGMRMNDTKGSENLEIQAEKDEHILVKNDKSEKVGNNETIEIGNDRTETVGNNEKISIGANRTEDVGGNETISISGNRNSTVSKNEVATVALTRTHSVGINEMINVGAAQEVSVGGVRLVTVGISQIVNVGLKHKLWAGNKIELESKKIILKASEELTLKCGAGIITIDAAGNITIKGPNVKINC